jgi:hypothetical protein
MDCVKVQKQREEALREAREEAAALRAEAMQARADLQRKVSELQSARAQAQAAAVYEQQAELLQRENTALREAAVEGAPERRQQLQAALEAADRHRVRFLFARSLTLAHGLIVARLLNADVGHHISTWPLCLEGFVGAP